jgi:hypothetical protein
MTEIPGFGYLQGRYILKIATLFNKMVFDQFTKEVPYIGINSMQAMHPNITVYLL